MEVPEERQATYFLRFLAILLIVNSHLHSLYPIPQLGTGGAIGNSLFFMLSGYGLALSEQQRKRHFFNWYGRRVTRIYPSLILAVLFLTVLNGQAWPHWGPGDYLENLVWPTPYWFIAALTVFYVIFFFFLKGRSAKVFLLGIGALVIPYLYFYVTRVDLSRYSIEGPGYFKWIFYLQIMFFGGYLSSREDALKGHIARDGMLLLGCVVLYYGILLLVDKGCGARFQAVTHLLMFPIMVLFLRVSHSAFVTIRLMGEKHILAGVSLVAGLTLEIYLLHGYVYNRPLVQGLAFPLNILCVWVFTVIAAFVLNRMSRFLTKGLQTSQ
jgi:peptidoglycan/LPS O-acetylase OafA/YrhL